MKTDGTIEGCDYGKPLSVAQLIERGERRNPPIEIIKLSDEDDVLIDPELDAKATGIVARWFAAIEKASSGPVAEEEQASVRAPEVAAAAAMRRSAMSSTAATT